METTNEPAESGFFYAPSNRDQAQALEDAIRKELDPIEFEVKNHHSHGVYGRELFIPAGTVLVGQIHKFENMNVLLEGQMTVTTDDGTRLVGAGFLIVSPPGTKRAAYAHTDCRWLTIHGTHETNIDLIERQFIAQNEQEYLSFCEEQKIIERG